MNPPPKDAEPRLPRSFQELLGAGYKEGQDFRIVTGNLEHLGECLLVAPHGGGIEPGTKEIVTNVAAMGSRPYYIFDGILAGDNWPLHIDSTRFDEPRLKELSRMTNFIVSIHGQNTKGENLIFVGGLHDLGKKLFFEFLTSELAGTEIAVVDAARHPRGQGISGLDPHNLTNAGRGGAGIQLEFSRGARRLLFPELHSRKGRRRRSEHLDVVCGAVERAISGIIVNSKGT